MPDITTYLQRVSWILRQGKPATDVAVYLPTHDAFAGFALGRDSVNQAMEGLIGPTLVPAILDAGYNFDFIDDGAIAAKGITHQILIVPNVERIPLATYQKIEEYAAKGGHVIFTKRLPSLAPGLRDEGDTPKIRELSAKFQIDRRGETGRRAARGAAGGFHRAARRRRGASQAAVLGYLLPRQHHAIVPVKGTAAFRVQGLQAAWWDPFTGKTSKADMTLDLAPYESRVLVFSKEAAPAIPASSGPRFRQST